MAELDKIPQKATVELEKVKLDDGVFESIQNLNGTINQYVSRFGEIYLRKKELSEELIRLDDVLEKFEDDFKSTNEQLREILSNLDEQYPQGRLDMADGTITYQPGALSKKQTQEQQAQQQNASSGLKVVKE
jgi:hypothetical protein